MLRCKALWLSILAILLLAVASKSAAPRREEKNDSKPSSSSTASSNDPAAAIVNGERIMLSELIGRLDELGVRPEKRELIAADVLDGLIDNALLVQFLIAHRIPYSAEEVDAQIAELRVEYEKEGLKFADALIQFGLTEQKLRAAAIAEAQWQNYVTKNVTDKQLADYFARYREYFDGTEVRASHILIEVSPDADAKTRAAAKGQIEKIRRELADGLDFAEAAQKYSDCPSKAQGGDVGLFPRRGRMVEPFSKAAFPLKVGQISSTVETQFGYHLVKVTQRIAGTRAKLDDPSLRSDLLDAFGERLKDEIVARERKTAKIEIAPGVKPPDQPTAKATTPPGKNRK